VTERVPSPARARPTVDIVRKWLGGHLVDVVLVLTLAGAGAMVGGSYYAAAAADGRPEFYQGEFAPAVMEACGRGFVNPVPLSVPALSQFLSERRTTLACAEIPADVKLTALGPFQVTFRYMMFGVSTYWRATGVSWDHLAPIFGALHGLVVGLAYLAWRVVFARWLAVALGLAIAISPMQLSILPYLRDAAKTPFFAADVFIVLLVWTRPLTTRTLLLLCGLFGVVAGIGVGFRPDVVMWFPMLVVALLFAQHAGLRRRLTAAALGLAVSVTAFGVIGRPVLAQYKAGSNFGHVALLGFAREFDARLGVRSGPYTVAPYYNDEFMYAAISGYAARKGYTGVLGMASAEYERYALMYFWEVTRTFSADVATRVGASITNVLNLPFELKDDASEAAVARVPALHRMLQARRRILGVLDGWGAGLVLLAFLMLAARSAALAWGFAITVLYLAGLPVIQFHPRHYSHLELIGMFALGIVVQAIAARVPASARAAVRDSWTWPSLRPRVVRVGACLAVVVLVPLIAVHVLRWRQQSVLKRLVAGYNLAAAEEVPYVLRPEDPDHVLLVPAGVPLGDRATPGRHVYGDYLVVDVGNPCDAVSFTMRVRYASAAGTGRFSRDVPVTLWPARDYGAARVFLPVYQYVDGNSVAGLGFGFAGLELSTSDVPCFTGLRRVPDTAGPALWLDLNLARNWNDRPLYQTFEDAAIADVHETTIYRSSPGLPLRRRWVDALTHVPPGTAAVSKTATVDPARGLIVNGIAESPFAYLAQLQPATVRAGSQLVVVGELFSGGLTVGLLKDQAWSRTLNVTTPGRFVAAVDASVDGTYVAMIANVNPARFRPTRFVITGVDWAPPALPPAGAR
jgi:hypothetical protein